MPEEEDTLDEAPAEPVIERPDAESEPVIERPDEDPVSSPGSASPAPSAETLWQELALDARELLKKRLLAGVMLDGTPLSYAGGILTVGFDRDYESMQYMMVEKEITLLTGRLRALTENPAACLRLELASGLATAPQIRERQTLDSLRQESEREKLVSDVLRMFHGRIVDVHLADEEKD